MRQDPTGPAAVRRTNEALKRFVRFLDERRLRLTGVRAAIVDAALARKGHYPIEDLIGDLKARGFCGSRATVYRNLPLLYEAGILRPAVVSSEVRSYETTFGEEHHDHLVCMRCGKIVEFGFEAFEILQRDVADRYGFELAMHHHELVGTCPECLARGDGQSGSAGTPPSGAPRGGGEGPRRG